MGRSVHQWEKRKTRELESNTCTATSAQKETRYQASNEAITMPIWNETYGDKIAIEPSVHQQ